MAGNPGRSHWLGSFAAGTLAALATLFIWQAGAEKSAQARDFSYLDHAAVRASQPANPNVAVHPATDAAPAPADRARAPRAVGVANGSYDTKVDGSTFVFGAPASSANPFSLRFGPVVVRSGEDLLTGGNVGDYDVANGGFEAKRGGVSERYMYDTNRVEQLVVITEAPAGKGAITVQSPVTVPTDSKVEVQGPGWRDARFAKGGLLFTDPAGKEVALVYGARAVDADGRQLDLVIGWDGSRMSMTVPASFVAIATLPITVDPWIELAGSGTSGVVGSAAGAFRQVSLALSPAGEQYVAFATSPGLDIAVRTFSTATSAWVDKGSLAPFTTGGSSVVPAITCPSGSAAPFVAWQETTGGPGSEEIHARQFIAGGWIEIFGSATGGGVSATPGATSDMPAVAIDSLGNQYVAWAETVAGVPEIYVKRNVGAGFVGVGGSAVGAGISGTPGVNTSTYPRIVIDGLDRPVVTWWETVGGSNYIYARRLEAGVWVELAFSGSGTGIPGSGFSQWPDVTFDSSNQPIVAWQENAPTLEIYAKRFDGAAWVDMAGSGSGTGISGTPGLADFVPVLGRDSLGNPVVAYNADTGAPSGNQIFVKRWTGFAWNQLEGSAAGPIGISGVPSPNFSPAIAVDSAGRPSVAWWNVPTGDARFRQYTGLALPTAISQTLIGGAAIPVGGATPESSVRFTGLVVSNGSLDEGRLQIEVKPVGTPFTGVPTAEGPLTPAGSTAEVTIPLVAGTYHWQARFESIYAGSPRSVWASFPLAPGGNPEASTDFSVGVPPAPPGALTLTQRKLDGSALATGGSTPEGAIIFRYTPPAGLPEDLRLQVSFSSAGLPDDAADVESPLQPAGSVAPINISVPLGVGSYEWKARLRNAAGLNSTYLAAPSSPPAFIVTASTGTAPGAPSTLGTFRLNGVTATPVPPLFSNESFVTFRATVTGAPGDLNRVQVDYTSPGTPGVPDGLPDVESPLAAPGTVVSITVPVADGSYDWQARQQSSTGLSSVGWTAFAGSPDFIIDSPISGPPPSSPTIVGQFRLDGTTPITLLTGTTTESGAVFKATLPASTDMLRLQLEIIPAVVGVPDFTGVPNAESPLVAGGTTIGISYPLGAGSYEWRVRTISSSGLTSAWVEAAPGEVIDLTVIPSGPVPTAPLLATLAQFNFDGSPLLLVPAALTDTVILQATLPAGIALGKLQFELTPVPGPAFTGTADVESAYVTGGSVASVTVPLAPGGYQWQVRSLTSTGVPSPTWTEFTAGGPPDFTIAAGAPPPAPPASPVTLTQLRPGAPPVSVPVGTTIAGNTVLFRADLPGAPTDLIRLQVEVVPSSGAFLGLPTFESPLFPGGTTGVTITASLSDNAYMWRARAFSSFDLASTGWVDFAAPVGTDFTMAGAGLAPAFPTFLDQQNPGGAPVLGAGATAAGDTVVFVGTVTGASGEPVRMQVEFTTGLFTGVADVESPMVISGSSVSISVPLAPGSYDWRAQTINGTGAASGYVALFGSSPDFVIPAPVVPVPPTAPLIGTLVQRNLDLSIVATAGIASGPEVVLEAQVPVGVPLGRIQFELQTATFGFSGSPDIESVLVPGGTTVQVTVPLAPGGYQWQARTQASTGLSSGYTEFAATTAADFTIAAAPPAPAAPATPLPIDQQTVGGVLVPPTGTVAGDTIVLTGTIPGAPTDLVRLQVEVVPAAPLPGFTGNPTHESSFQAGGTVAAIFVSRPDGAYRWRARSYSSFNLASPWVDFGAAVGVDFNLASTGLTPPVTGSLDQRNVDGSAIPAGGTAGGAVVVFVGTVSGASGEPVRLQVDFAPTGSLSAFVADLESPLVPSGSTVQVSASFGNGTYEWQARTVNGGGAASATTTFGAIGTDFTVVFGGPGVPPTAPLVAGMDQLNLGGPSIISGGTATGSTVVFRAVVPGAATDFNRIQVDFEIGALDLVPDVESALVPGGSTVDIAVPLGIGSYDWAARTMNSSGLVSGYTPFPGGSPDFIVAAPPPPAIPGAPVAGIGTMDQQNLDGTSIGSGATALGSDVVFRVVVPGLGTDLNRIQVSVEPTGTLDLFPNYESPLVAGGSAVFIHATFGNGSYEWQARTQSSLGANSAYTAFGVAGTDFVVQAGGPTPTIPGLLAQMETSGSVIPAGGTTFTNTVMFRGRPIGAVGSDLVRLQVDIELPGSLDGIAEVESPYVPSSTDVFISVPLGNGSYEWQARTVGPAGAPSAWAEFAAGTGTDFIVNAGTGLTPPPPDPLLMDQMELDGTSIPSGATVYSDTVQFQAVVGVALLDPSLVRLQVDFSPLSGTVPDVESPFVPSGSAVTLQVQLADGSYDWRARSLTSMGALSAWTSFPGGSPDFIIDANQVTNPPATPTVLGQQDPLGVAIPVGGQDTYDSISFFATIPGLPTDLIRLQLEIKPVTDVFTGVPDVESILLAGGSTAFVTIPLGNGSYHWQARAQRSVGVSSSWVEFGANPTASIDFTMNSLFPGFAPPAPTGLAQLDGSMQNIAQDSEISDGDLFFQGVVTGDPAKMFKFQVEVRSTSELFTGLPGYESIFLPTGSTAQVHAFLGSGPFHWQARTITSSNVVGPWVSFGSNGEDERDFEIRSPQAGVDHHVSNTRKRHLLCGLTGIEIPALFGLWLLGRKVVRRARKGKSSK